MAIRSAWWMQNTSTKVSQSNVYQPRTARANTTPTSPHWSTWPSHLPSSGLELQILDTYLNTHRGNECDVLQFRYGTNSNSGQNGIWTLMKRLTSPSSLEQALTEASPRGTFSILYLVSRRSAKVIQLLGHYLDLSPRFFNTPFAVLSTGSRTDRYVFFRLQFMEQYTSHKIPEESRSNSESPSVNFRTKNGYAAHTWHVTHLLFALVQQSGGTGPHMAGICILDDLDVGFKEGLEKLMTKVEDAFPGPPEAVGVSEVMTEILYMVAFTWGVMLTEAETHLNILSKSCVDSTLSSTDQLVYMRELHQMTPLWVQVKRRIVGARDVAQQMMQHSFFASIGTQEPIVSYLNKTVYTLNDHLDRVKELGEETNVLISLIFNISTLQDTRAAMEESRAANRIASSVRRLSILTFFYLPLSLSAGIFGMNVTEITADVAQLPIWTFLVLAFSLLGTTVAVWSFWSVRRTNNWIYQPGSAITRVLDWLHS